MQILKVHVMINVIGIVQTAQTVIVVLIVMNVLIVILQSVVINVQSLIQFTKIILMLL